jgi:pimeloyl-ACP methyl ester carboxylesterase
VKNLYIFSGLGADQRVFQNMDFSEYNAIFIDWIKPNHSENMADYAKRLSSKIEHEKPILIGLSFGGMIATEMAKIIETEKVMLIASAKTKHEIPFYFRLAGKLRLHKLIPTKLLKLSNCFVYWLFGTQNKSDQLMLTQILKDTDETFLRWAIDKIVTWQNITINPKTIHIHGTSDKILPIHFIDCQIKVQNGGHLMTLNKAAELNQILKTVVFSN